MSLTRHHVGVMIDRLGPAPRRARWPSGLARLSAPYYAEAARWHAVACDGTHHGRGRVHEAVEATGAIEAEAVAAVGP